MKFYKLNDSTIRIYEQHEALTAAGSDEHDDVFEQDAALEEFFQDCKVEHLVWNLSTYNEDLTRLVSSGAEVIIIIRE